ncbi:hypothetical protein Leryth_022327 [Lithospermum erythrorhizon]|nr:hypothetical protein Leryth_022327 [Lithospermum erythrorhizon]
MKNVEQAIGFLDSSIFNVVRSPLVVATPNKGSDVTVGKNVKLLGNGIPNRVIAHGVLISMTPDEIVFGVPLGLDFWKIYIKDVTESDHHLVRARRGMKTVGQAYHNYVPWQISDVSQVMEMQ